MRETRNQRGFSLKFVCEKTGIKDSTLSRIEREKNKSELYSISLVDLYCMAGYLSKRDISSYRHTFQKVDLLTEKEKMHIQEEIDLFTKGRDAS